MEGQKHKDDEGTEEEAGIKAIVGMTWGKGRRKRG